MARGLTEIDRLIEQGLTLYGEGDLDGALLLWERVLAIDPDNAQANSYVDYVRINYDLLTGEANTNDSGPFAIGDDEPEYQIEILPGEEVPPAPARSADPPLSLDEHDGGWMIGDEAGGGDGADLDRRAGLDSAIDSLEMDADEPPSHEPSFESATTGEQVSFDDNTREYPGGAGRPAIALLGDGPHVDSPEFIPETTPAFGGPADLQTPPGFGSQVTEMRRRDLGFVQPSSTSERARVATPGPPELKISLRTPISQSIPVMQVPADAREPAGPGSSGHPNEPSDLHDLSELNEPSQPSRRDPHRAPTAEGDDIAAAVAQAVDGIDQAGYGDELALDLTAATDAKTIDFDAAETRQVGDIVGRGDLIQSLPLPRTPASATRPLPLKTRLPAESWQPGDRSFDRDGDAGAASTATSALTNAMTSAVTTELPLRLTLDPVIPAHPQAPPVALTRELAEHHPVATMTRTFTPEEPLISAPTVELGLRERRPPTDEEATREVDAHKVRKMRATGTPDLPGIDPIDARSAEILSDVDRSAPAVETREDRTRRRITALLERATEWSERNDLDRAVTAVDLALSEDPNSALAQKLVHRNRETIMTAFQAFLGDLQRIPQLARPLHELGSAPISPRAAFLLSRVDGTLSLDEILDVSGMPRLEAYRYLCQLFLRAILR